MTLPDEAEKEVAADVTGPAPKDGDRRLPRRTMMQAVFGGLAAAAGGLVFAQKHEDSSRSSPKTDGLPKRLVSLSPGVTETLLELGQGRLLVAVSDYCKLPRGMKVPQVGTAITPNFERIAGARPDLIISSEVAGDTLAPLKKLAPTLTLPWLTLEQWLGSIRTIGATVDCEQEATRLIEKIKLTLSPVFGPKAPRVLLALDYASAGTNETWFIRRNSIHGVALEAAGGKNAVARDVVGQPKLSAEALLAVDPDAIIVLRSEEADARLEAQAIAHFEKWPPLSAVQNKRIAVISMPNLLTVGPSVLELVPQFESTLAVLFSDLSMSRGRENDGK